MDTTPIGERVLALGKLLDIRALLTAAELDLFTRLAKGPKTAARLAADGRFAVRPLIVVLDALVAVGYLAKENGVYSCPPEVARVLSADGEATVLPMLRHHAGIWARASRLTGLVRGGDEFGSPLGEDEARRAFIQAMHARARENAAANVAAMQPGNAQRLLDIGGGSGSYTVEFLKACPKMTATLFDLPPVVEMARERLTAERLVDRVGLVPGDFEKDPLPPGHDLALLSAIIHQNSPAQNLMLFKKVFAALVPGGRLVIRDHVMSEDHTAPESGALFAINMLVSTPGGGTYSFSEIREGLEEAGFRDVRLLRGDAEMESLVDARKP